MKRNAASFLVTTWEVPAPAGAIQIVTMPEGHANAGEIAGINHACPCGCGRGGWMSFEAYGFKEFWGPQPKHGDDLTKLSLTPSIGFMKDAKTGQYHWHGYLKNGVFEEC